MFYQMNLKFKSFFALGALAVFTTAGKAQVATISTKNLFAGMPVFAKIDTLVEGEAGKYSQEFVKKKFRAQLLVTAVDSLKGLPAKSAELETATAAAQAAIKDFKEYEASANKRIADYKEVLLRPYLDKVEGAIKVVARRLKYKQVVDTEQVSFVYIDASADITEAVLAELKKN